MAVPLHARWVTERPGATDRAARIAVIEARLRDLDTGYRAYLAEAHPLTVELRGLRQWQRLVEARELRQARAHLGPTVHPA